MKISIIMAGWWPWEEDPSQANKAYILYFLPPSAKCDCSCHYTLLWQNKEHVSVKVCDNVAHFINTNRDFDSHYDLPVFHRQKAGNCLTLSLPLHMEYFECTKRCVSSTLFSCDDFRLEPFALVFRFIWCMRYLISYLCCSYQTCRQISHHHFLFVSMVTKTSFPAQSEASVCCCSIGQEVNEENVHRQQPGTALSLLKNYTWLSPHRWHLVIPPRGDKKESKPILILKTRGVNGLTHLKKYFLIPQNIRSVQKRCGKVTLKDIFMSDHPPTLILRLNTEAPVQLVFISVVSLKCHLIQSEFWKSLWQNRVTFSMIQQEVFRYSLTAFTARYFYLLYIYLAIILTYMVV